MRPEARAQAAGSARIRRVAVFHDLPAGGAKRTLAAFLAELGRRGIATDLYRLDSYGDAPPAADALASRAEVLELPRRRLDRLPLTSSFALLNVPIGYINTGFALAERARLAALLEGLAARIDGSRADVAFVHACGPSYAPALLRYLRTPTAYYCQEPPRRLYEPAWESLAAAGLDEPPIGRLIGAATRPAQLLDDALYRRADARSARAAGSLLVNSDYSREVIYRAYGLFARVVRLGVDSQLFSPSAPRVDGLVLSAGRIHPLKGHELALAAVARLPASRRPRLLIIGDGELAGFRRRLEQQAARAGVALELRVGVSDRELVLAYSQASVVLSLPVMEPLGLVALEAMACEAAVIGVREAGLRETIRDGETGLLAARDAREIADQLDGLLGSPRQRHELGLRARREVVERWSWERATDDLLDAFAALVADAGERGATTPPGADAGAG